LIDDDYPNILVVPLTNDASLVIPELTVTIDPTPDNGCPRRCFALVPSVTSVSTRRIRETPSRIRPDQLTDIRRRILTAIGVG
jgi:mRNA interferase MazF